MNDVIIAVDPGREKCGLAAVSRQHGVAEQGVVETALLAESVQQLLNKYNACTVAVGDRTASRSAQACLKPLNSSGQPVSIVTVDEHRSTEQARQRYWQANPPRGWRRLLPVTMQMPPVPIDDYVAVILAERYFAKYT